ncbi:hypothetical protein B0H14DRAFT_2981777 [Mycena olivaceomarginata]|nr:hypothetical protein B0H14DRAFT_2981777 [Mycena olivaceomarginata]
MSASTSHALPQSDLSPIMGARPSHPQLLDRELRRHQLDPGASDPLQLARLRTALRIVREDPRLLVLGLIQTCFEGSMYLFFLWLSSAVCALAVLALAVSGSQPERARALLAFCFFEACVRLYYPCKACCPAP